MATKRRKGGRGKRKGSAFERKVCASLSLWVTAGKRKDVFWRSSMSGGRATIHLRKGQKLRQTGDITAVAPEGTPYTDVWFFECKHYQDLDILSFLLFNRGKLAKFWTKAQKEAASYGRRPMLIAKQNLLPILVVTKADELPNVKRQLYTEFRTNIPYSVDLILFSDLLKSNPEKAL